MSVGLPVVATAVGGLPEIIDDGVHGYLVERDDRGTTAVLLAERIATLLTDAGTRARLGIAARARIQEAFSPAAAARTTLRWYGRAVAARRDRGGW
jgi:starch synthase